MVLGYRAMLALTSLLLLPAPVSAARSPHRIPHHRRVRRLDSIRGVAPGPAQLLFSRHALREARIILQLKLLELRSERLDRVRKAIESREPIDDLLKEP